MTPEMLDLARRAVACRGWRWMPGMRTTCDLRVVDGGDEYVIGYRSGPTRDGGGWYDGEAAGLLPDFDDAATLGCLLALVREAHGQTTLSPVSRGRRLWCLADYGTTALEGKTEIELLVRALEAAP